ncbi:MAG: hypothetical protein KGK10_06215 [Rhodospirillales bacterium]|nr:hypothetical protein [Rhodospirillales bacterium]
MPTPRLRATCAPAPGLAAPTPTGAPPARTGRARRLALLLALPVLPLAACATGRPHATAAARIDHGVIVAVRPVGPAAPGVGNGPGNGTDVRAAVLAALAGPAGTADGTAGEATVQGIATQGIATQGIATQGIVSQGGAAESGAVELIIREDNGHTLSVVQSGGHFRPGDRVLLTRGARTRIALAS